MSDNPVDTFKSFSRNDQIFLGAGLLTFIFSFIAFAKFSVSFDGFGGSSTISAWHGVGTLAGLLVLVAVAVDAVVLFAPSSVPDLPVSPRVAAVGAAALALVFFLIRWVTLPSQNYLGHHYGFSLAWGGYITLVLNIVAIAFGFLALKASGDSLPWESKGPAASPVAPPAPPAPPAS